MDPLVVSQIHWYHLVLLLAVVVTIICGFLATKKNPSKLTYLLVDKVLPVSAGITIVTGAYSFLVLLIK